MSIRKQATFTDEEFKRAEVVADYENHAFARFIVHCVNKETDKRYGDAMAKLATDKDKMAPTPLPEPGAGIYASLADLESEIEALNKKVEDFLSTGRLPDALSQT